MSNRAYWHDSHRILHNKDCRSMVELPDESIQMIVTSPPYWGLRKYAGLPDLIWGGDGNCEHQWDETVRNGEIYDTKTGGAGSAVRQAGIVSKVSIPSSFCSLCGAGKGAYGLEPTPEMYVQHTIEILREVRRVLRKDGVVFWNIGDSYAANRSYQVTDNKWVDVGNNMPSRVPYGLKPKDLCLIPFRVAIAAQEDGWWVRSVIIWNKPNPMPESVRDRPTESHEYILMLTKSARYYYDQEAVREPTLEYTAKFRSSGRYVEQGFAADNSEHNGNTGGMKTMSGRNLRSVWEFSTQSYKEAHFATYPEKLVEICVKAATPEVGCCSKCGRPWVRIITKQIKEIHKNKPSSDDLSDYGKIYGRADEITSETLGWKQSCKCEDADKVPSIVLDPFCGSGTTLKVAAELGRRAIGYELSQDYCALAVDRNSQGVLQVLTDT